MNDLVFISSDIQLMVTITYSNGEKEILSMKFQTQKHGVFKEALERELLKKNNSDPFNKKIIKVRIH